jgi:hypothetical protein
MFLGGKNSFPRTGKLKGEIMRRSMLLVVILLMVALVPGLVSAEAPTSQPTTSEIVKGAKDLVQFGNAEQWFSFSAGAIWLFMSLFKLGRKRLKFMQRIPKRVLWILVPLLSVVAMVLGKLQADLSWNAAIATLLSGPAAAFLNDLVKRGLLGKSPSPMK